MQTVYSASANLENSLRVLFGLKIASVILSLIPIERLHFSIPVLFEVNFHLVLKAFIADLLPILLKCLVHD